MKLSSQQYTFIFSLFTVIYTLFKFSILLSDIRNRVHNFISIKYFISQFYYLDYCDIIYSVNVVACLPRDYYQLVS